MRLSGRISEQLKLPVAKDDAAVAANEALLIFIRLPFPLNELRIALSASLAFLLWNYLVPLLQTDQLFSAVIQHFVERTVGEMLLGINLENADPDLGAFKDRTKKLLARTQLFLSLLAFRDINKRNDGPGDFSAL